MQGDVADISGRLRALLPNRWFPDQSPNLEAILTCLATPWAWLYQLVQYVIRQTRLKTAREQWLDLIALDFFGASLRREPGETDTSYRGRIEWALVQEAATRGAVSANLARLTGSPPGIFEPTNCADTGAYGSGTLRALPAYSGMAYGAAGGWGSLLLPFQFFLEVRRPAMNGVSALAGYRTGGGGYGLGNLAYVDLASLSGSVTDKDIEMCLRRSLPINSIAWLRIT